MSTYDDSSLFLYPSGYKASVLFAQKPMDANGQLAFTRSNDTATRVDENLLIEKVRTNLLLQSNTFSTTWSPAGGTVTSGQAGYDGTNNAWLFQNAGTTSPLLQSISLTSESRTFSVYAKKNATYGIRLYAFGSSNINAHFNLNTGTVINAIGDAKIEVVNSEWFRCSISGTQTITQASIYINNNTATQVLGSAIIQNSQLETGDIATDYIATTTTAVSVGPLANIPRIDYLGGGCGKLLLEPQRTNLQTFSENIDDAVYGKTNVTISANATTSPDGYSNADKIVENTTNAVHRISGFGGVMSSGTTYTSSFFAKKAERDQVYILIPTSVAATRTVVVFNLTTGVSSVVSGSSATSHSMVDYGNGWYRCIATFTTTAVGTNLIGIYNGAEDYAGTTDFGLFLYGLMNEAGSYASSYVPTLAASVTRGADSCSKQNIAGTLPTAYPFTLYAEGFLRENNDVLISINDIAQSDVYYQIGATAAGFFASARNSTTSVITTASGRSVGTHKVAAVFTSSEIRLFANGALIATGANAQTFNASANDVLIGQLRVSSDLGLRSSVNQALVFKSALSDADCIALTA